MEEFNKRELIYQAHIIDAALDGKNIYYRRIKPLNPDLLQSYEWKDAKLHLALARFNFEEFEYRVESEKKIKNVAMASI